MKLLRLFAFLLMTAAYGFGCVELIEPLWLSALCSMVGGFLFGVVYASTL